MELQEIDDLIDKHLKSKTHLLGGSVQHYNVTGIVNGMFRNTLREIIFETCERNKHNSSEQLEHDALLGIEKIMELQCDKFRDCDNFNGFAKYQLTQKVKITPVSVIKEGAYIRVYFTRHSIE